MFPFFTRMFCCCPFFFLIYPSFVNSAVELELPLEGQLRNQLFGQLKPLFLKAAPAGSFKKAKKILVLILIMNFVNLLRIQKKYFLFDNN